ncbi:unnamed protein product [Darwinula stevensoni]|uniref:Peptidase S1 domain-containing protein n=1 Tax=Darwinula stevensoni TaxID=69355 RepID=A0A7R8XKE3_9CRUS|nr:unnamed protein product [Darwinula stevensoni]CAG0895115.1 unnamed protein product [Darwinula stevensoni]
MKTKMISPTKFSLIVLLFCSFGNLATGQRSGFIFPSHDPCSLNGGVCTKIAECPGAVARNLSDASTIRSLLCSSKSSEPLICCDQATPTLPASSTSSPPPPKRVSQTKCEEYKASQKSVTCEKSQKELIVGGEAAKPYEFPHMALVGEKLLNGNISWKCGGTLISKEWILTAAHCINNEYVLVFSSVDHDSPSLPLMARLGEHDLNDVETITYDYSVTKFVIHPRWGRGGYRIKYHDIALLQLDREVHSQHLIFPACLPTEEEILTPERNNSLSVAGWGNNSIGEIKSRILQKVSVPLMGPSDCDQVLSKYPRLGLKRIYPKGVKGRILCAGTGGKDSCQGDSGGPLMLPLSPDSCVYTIVGIVSTGVGCGNPDFPGFYTQVSSYLDWIEGIVWKTTSATATMF